MLLGVDLGTSAIKLGLLTEEGRIIATHSVPHRVLEPRPGWTEMEPDAWWEGLRAGIAGVCRKADLDPASVRAVSFSVLYPALVCMDAAGRPLRPAILYSDQRSVKQSQWLKEHLDPARMLRTTGNGTPTGTCSLTGMLWVKENEPEIFDRTRWLGHANTYLAHRLTGETAMDWVSASLSGVFETEGGRGWSPWICEQAGIPVEKLPPLLSPMSEVGKVTAEAAQLTGLPKGAPVAIGAGDTGCSVFGAGLLTPGELCLTCGTTDNLAFIADRPDFDARFANCAHVIPNRWVFIATMTNTGAALEWFKRNFYEAQAEKGASLYDRIFSEADAAPPGAGGLLFLPYLQGERSPVWDPFARGVFCGLKLTSSKRDMLRAVLEGVAYAIRQNMEIIEGLGAVRVREILTMGGSAKSRVWNRIKASVLGKPVRPLEFGETSLLGAAMLAGIAAGVYKDAPDAVSHTRTFAAGEPILPMREHRGAYDRLFAAYLELYRKLRPAFPRLAQALSSR